MNILKIGVTGSAGSGKSMVCEAFKFLGLVVLDCDEIARQVVVPGEPAYNDVVACFGSGVVLPDKTLDRGKLRNLMVNQPGLRKKLESLLHPAIIREMVRQMETAVYDGEQACAVEVPLLFELGMAHLFDLSIAVTAPGDTLVKRISARDNVSLESAGKILDIQMDQSEKIKLADHVIENHGSRRAVYKAVERLYNKVKNKS